MMKRVMILTASMSLAACASHTNIEIDQLTEARAAVAASKAAGAERCAPKLQAEAVASLYWAAHEYSEHGIHPDENSSLAAKAIAKANEARTQGSKNCAPAPKPAPKVVEVI